MIIVNKIEVKGKNNETILISNPFPELKLEDKTSLNQKRKFLIEEYSKEFSEPDLKIYFTYTEI